MVGDRMSMPGADAVAKIEHLRGIDETAEVDGVELLRLSRCNRDPSTRGRVQWFRLEFRKVSRKGFES